MILKTHRWHMYIMTVVGWLWLSMSTFAAMIHVPADQPTIQSGIDAAENGDTVLVNDGVYIGEGNVNISFSGKEITVKSRNGAEATIIDCEETLNTRGSFLKAKSPALRCWMDSRSKTVCTILAAASTAIPLHRRFKTVSLRKIERQRRASSVKVGVVSMGKIPQYT